MFCLVTDLLDVEVNPALDLACAYPQRSGCETVIGHHRPGSMPWVSRPSGSLPARPSRRDRHDRGFPLTS